MIAFVLNLKFHNLHLCLVSMGHIWFNWIAGYKIGNRKASSSAEVQTEQQPEYVHQGNDGDNFSDP